MRVPEAVGRNIVVLPTILIEEVHPDSPHGNSAAGIVKSVGPTVAHLISRTLAPGDIVLFRSRCGYALGEGLIGVDAEDIFAVHKDWPEANELSETVRRENVFSDVRLERHGQVKKWGGAVADDQNTQKQWVDYINEYASGVDRAEKHDFRTRMVKATALAVAAIESHDRKAEADAAGWGQDACDAVA